MKMLATGLCVMYLAGFLSLDGQAQELGNTDKSLRPLAPDDVLSIQTVDETVLSPDGQWAAVVIKRPRTGHETYQRVNADAHADVWLVSMHGGAATNVTHGARDASGYWYPRWSPRGDRLAMVAIHSAGYIQAYVWDLGSRRLSPLSERPLDVDFTVVVGPSGTTGPFAWVNETTLFVPLQPAGSPGLVSQRNAGFFNRISTIWAQAGRGRQTTALALESGFAPTQTPAPSVELALIDTVTKSSTLVTVIPQHSWEGSTSLNLSSNGRQLGILIDQGYTAFSASHPNTWSRQALVGRAELVPNTSVIWHDRPVHAASLMGWSPDSGTLALWMAADAQGSRQLALWRSGQSLAPVALSGANQVSSALWADSGQLLLYASDAGSASGAASRRDWWTIPSRGNTTTPLNLTGTLPSVPSALCWGSERGSVLGVAGGRLWALTAIAGAVRDVSPPDLADITSIATCANPYGNRDAIVVQDAAGRYHNLRFAAPRWSSTEITGPLPALQLADYDPTSSTVAFTQTASDGTFLWSWCPLPGHLVRLLRLNEQLAGIADARRLLIQYVSTEGQSLKGVVLLPLGYTPGRRYPTVAWVYEGVVYRDTVDDDNGFLRTYADKNNPNVFNLQLLTARGYAVLLPSMPFSPGATTHPQDPYLSMLSGLMPAVDELVRLGIADDTRLGIMGQSGGGYAVNAIVTQTARFRAAVSLAGIADLVSFYGAADAMRDRYTSAEWDSSSGLVEYGQFNMRVPPWENPQRYIDNSPIFHLQHIETPLLIVNGDQDAEAPQSEELFTGLQRLGKRARLVRYPGEDHVLESPANIRDLWNEIFCWLDKNL